MNTFTKFDALGACLTELSFDCIDLQFTRYSTGRERYTVTLQSRRESNGFNCAIGDGDTASAALENALKRYAEKQAEAVERAAA